MHAGRSNWPKNRLVDKTTLLLNYKKLVVNNLCSLSAVTTLALACLALQAKSSIL
jgi:hypothetical protein